jgi:hypothetical protein
LALHPALISGQVPLGKSWRGGRSAARAAEAEAAASAEQPTVDLAADLSSLGHLSQRIATVFGTVSVAVLWTAEWLSSSTAKSASMPVIIVGVATALLGVLFAVIALALDLITRVRLVQSPQLTTLAQHRQRIEAESAAFRESLPALAPRPERRITRRGLRRRR